MDDVKKDLMLVEFFSKKIKASKLSTAELSEATGLSKTFFYKIGTKRRLSPKAMVSLSIVLNCEEEFKELVQCKKD